MNIGANFWPKSDKCCTIPPSKTRQPILQYFTAIIRLLSRNSSTLASETVHFRFLTFFSSKRCIAYVLTREVFRVIATFTS